MLGSAIFRRYWITTSALVTSLLVAFGAIEAFLAYRQNVMQISERQRLEARAAAREIQMSLAILERQVQEVAQLPWSANVLTDSDRQQEFQRLQKLIPAISELRAVDGSGRERVFVSRSEPDRVGSGIESAGDPLPGGAAAEEPIAYGPIYFRNGTEPFVSLGVRERAGANAATFAELDLRHVVRTVRQLRVGTSGRAFLIDPANRIIAHPSLSKTLTLTDLSGSEQVRQLRTVARTLEQGLPASLSVRNTDGEDVRTTAVQLTRPPWLLIVEEPLDEAMLPVRNALIRTMLLLVVGLIAAFAMSLWLARRLTRPVIHLRDGAVRVGGGDLAARIQSDAGDELAEVGTAFNRMAETLQRSHAELELKVRERTAALASANEQVGSLNAELRERVRELGHRRDEADRANAAKTRFLASASHDLRQPMHTISLLVGTLKEQTQGRQIAKVVSKIETSIDAMESLFGSLLDISKLDAGVVKPDVGEVSVSAILRNLEIHFAPQAQAKGLSLRIEDCNVVVASDPALLERILGNLVANAVNYTAQGSVVVGCRVRQGRAHLLVADSGIGIPASQLKDVFEEFVQLDNPGRDRSKGLGLGLSIVKRSADLLGHRLIARSVEGKGSVFGVEVPFIAHEATPPASTSSPEPAEQTLRGAFVAVVDDVEENRFAMEALCKQWGCLVVSASAGKEIATLLAQHLRTPDLVISDYRLRDGETGLDVIEEIRRTAEIQIPAIVVTGDVSASSDARFGSAGVILLHKPLNPQQLLRAAEALLAAKAAPEPPA